MATRAITQIRTSLINALSHPSFSIRGLSTFSHAQSPAPLGSSGGLLQRNLGCSPAFRPLITNPHYGSSLCLTRLSQSACYSSPSGYANVNPKFAKQRRNRGEMKGNSSNELCFGKYGLQVLDPAWITHRQILAGQLAIKRNMRGGKFLLRIFPHKPVSLKPAETRMGRGKGNVAFWVAGVRAGRIIFEINGVPENVARKAISVAASKFPVRMRFVKA